MITSQIHAAQLVESWYSWYSQDLTKGLSLCALTGQAPLSEWPRHHQTSDNRCWFYCFWTELLLNCWCHGHPLTCATTRIPQAPYTTMDDPNQSHETWITWHVWEPWVCVMICALDRLTARPPYPVCHVPTPVPSVAHCDSAHFSRLDIT